MKTKQQLYLLLYLSVLLVGCTEAVENDGSVTSSRDLSSCPTIIREAMRQIPDGSVSSLTFDVSHNRGEVRTRSAGQSPNTWDVEWETYRLLSDGQGTYAVVDLKGEFSAIQSYQSFGGKKRRVRNKSVSKLFIRQSSEGRLETYVGTYVFDKRYARRHAASLDTLGLNFSEMNFSGYFVVSRLNGEMLYGRSYEGGKEQFLFMPTYRVCSLPWAESDTLSHIALFSEREARQTRSSASRALSSEGGFAPCSFCGKSLETCTCLSIIGCKICRQKIDDGACLCKFCPVCGQNITAGECICRDESRCEVCLLDKSSCICDRDSWQDGTNTDSGGGSSGGSGGSTVGGSSSGGGTGNSSNGVYGTALIRAAVNKAVDEFKSKYIVNGVYHAACNLGVQRMFELSVGAKGVPGMSGRANDMVKAWGLHPEYWQKVTMADAIRYAESGYFVVCGWYNPTGNSGHVTVIVAGKKDFMEGQYWPYNADTGAKMRESFQSTRASYGPKKRNNLVFYYYKRN